MVAATIKKVRKTAKRKPKPTPAPKPIVSKPAYGIC